MNKINQHATSHFTADVSRDGPNRWRAGFATKDITPSESIFLAGWGSRDEPSKGVSHPIYVKTMALQHGVEAPAVIVTSDLLAFSLDMVTVVVDAARENYGLERSQLILSASHNHSAPVTRDVLPLYYDLSQAQHDVINRYSDWLEQRIIEAIGEALSDLSPATLEFGQSLAGFAVNRRRIPGSKHLKAVVDQDVPVFVVRGEDSDVRGVMFGYACHTTSIRDGKINGDYAGYAQSTLEKAYPDATALFVAGCGGDANPQPRWEPGLGECYGRVLATAVEQVIGGDTMPVEGPLYTSYGEVDLPFEKPLDRSEIIARKSSQVGVRLRELDHLLDMLDGKLPLPRHYSYPLQVWRFGQVHTLIAMTSEVVADYALRFKQTYGCENTWVMAYTNEAVAYIPSKRVRLEGGYEGTLGMLECGLPAPFKPEVEERIANQVEKLVTQCCAAQHQTTPSTMAVSKF